MSTTIKLELTSRGFTRGEFIDSFGEKCSIQKSSLATEDCIWLGCDEGPNRMHLTRDMAANLVVHIQRFVETGNL